MGSLGSGPNRGRYVDSSPLAAPTVPPRPPSCAAAFPQIEAIYHTGIVVGGVEYYFGGGIQAAPVGQSPFGEPMRILDLGVTHLSAAVRAELLDDLSQRYTAESYSLLSNNCSEC